jgi:apolipoprotein N-acyltransferase
MTRKLLDWCAGPGLPGHLLALVAGGLSTLSLTPFDLWPMALLSAGLLYLGLTRVTGAQAFWRGWFWGLGLFLTGVSWVYVSIHVHGSAPPALAALLTGLFVAGLALIPGLMGWVWAKWIRPQGRPWLATLGFASLWFAQELFRGWFLTGFPWMYHGYAHTDSWLAGWAPVGGVWLAGFLSVLSACLLAELLLRRGWIRAGLTATVLAAIWLGGLALTWIDWTEPVGRPLSVALIQADIAQARKWDPEHIEHTLSLYRDMSYAQGPVDLILWPETAIPVLQSRAMPFIQGVAANLAEQGTTLITGIPVDEYDIDGLRIYNGLMVAGENPHAYLKHKLVPFGEYVPLEAWLRGLIAFFDLPMSSFSRGPREQAPLEALGYRLAPFICYATGSPQRTVDFGQQRQLVRRFHRSAATPADGPHAFTGKWTLDDPGNQ